MAANKRTRYRVRLRKFLNRDQEMPAFIIGVVQDTSSIPDDDKDASWKWGDIELKLGDCYDRVSFEFRMSTRTERANSLHKINLLAEAMNAVRDAIEAEVHSINARPRERQKAGK
jgi:hypothetical protein